MYLHMMVPTRGRPANAHRLIEAFAQTKMHDATRLTFYVDEDDTKKDEYLELFLSHEYDTVDWFGFVICERRGLAGTLNEFAPHVATTCDFIGFMGDDHVPTSYGWDFHYIQALQHMKMGFVYGNDLLQRENLPTQVAMTSNVVKTLGYMVPLGLRHMYLDNFWLDMGRAINGITYLDDVIIEHRHPLAQKAEWDEGYAEVNAGQMYANDLKAYQAYTDVSFADDVWKLMAVKGGL